jgi:uncharacterized protein (TIGR02646 family)
MRYIEKRADNEPIALRLHRAQKLALPDYDNFREKKDILEALWKEQFGLCAYCMQGLQDWIRTKMRIEHFKPEDTYNGENDYPNLLLEYSNYLGVCQGGQNGAKHLYHCDKSKRNVEILICPHNEQMMLEIKFASDGTIFLKTSEKFFKTIKH